MGTTADLIRDRANLHGEIDRAALDRLPGRQREASWVVCRSATVPPRRQETVPMAGSDAVTLLDVMQAILGIEDRQVIFSEVGSERTFKLQWRAHFFAQRLQIQ